MEAQLGFSTRVRYVEKLGSTIGDISITKIHGLDIASHVIQNQVSVLEEKSFMKLPTSLDRKMQKCSNLPRN